MTTKVKKNRPPLYARRADEGDGADVPQQPQAQTRLVPLRIDSRTVIYVPPEKCNEEHAAAYRRKMGLPERRLT